MITLPVDIQLREIPPLTIGVMGSAGGNIPVDVRRRVRELGEQIGKRGYVLITGACPGLPHEAALGAKMHGGIVVGISPALNLEEHITKYHSPTRAYDCIVYTGSGLMGREVENIRSCDAVIFCGGRSGTLGEFAIAYDEGKVIGILRGTGGITDHIETIVGMTGKKTKSILVPHYDPDNLLDAIEKIYLENLLPRYKKVLEGHDPDGVLDM